MKQSYIKIGQIVYLDPVYKKGIEEATITKIGTKYFYVKPSNGMEVKFNLSDLRQKSTGHGRGYDYTLYLSKQDYFDEVEKRKLYLKVYTEIKRESKFTLDQLRRIKAILEEDNDKHNNDV